MTAIKAQTSKHRLLHISSRDNAQVKAIKRLAQSNAAYKERGLLWLEGEHLCDAYLTSERRCKLQTAVLSESSQAAWLPRLSGVACDVMVLPDQLMRQLSSLPSSGGIAFVMSTERQEQPIDLSAHTLILDGVQDAGNVGSILRSAAAFGVTQVLALQGTAALWSPKVLRAAMGAHFSLHLIEDLQASSIQLAIPILATHVHGGQYLHELQSRRAIPHPCAWVMGHEGQGVSDALLQKANLRVRIWQQGQESLNVAAAAAVCLYASMR